jgi:hypothetical protein
MAVADEHTNNIGQVLLSLVIVVPDTIEGITEEAPVKYVHGGIHLGDGPLLRACVSLFDNGRDRIVHADNSSIPARIVDVNRKNGRSSTGIGVVSNQRDKGFGPDQGHVPRKDDHNVMRLVKPGETHRCSVTCSILGFLNDRYCVLGKAR